MKRSWQIGFVLLAAGVLTFLYDLAGNAGALSGLTSPLNRWLKTYTDFWTLSHVFFVFCVVMGVSGIGEELAERTVRLWLLRPRSRAYFLFVSEAVGGGAVLALFLVPLVFLAAARWLIGPAPQQFSSPVPLLCNALLVGLTLFAASRFLMFRLRSVRLAIAIVFGSVIGLETLGQILPASATKFLPLIEPLVEPGLILTTHQSSYPIGQTCAMIAVCIACYVAEFWIFRHLDVRV